MILSHQASLFDTGVQLSGPNSELPSGARAQARRFFPFAMLNSKGFNHPLVPNLSIVALAPHVDDHFTIVRYVQRCLLMKVSGKKLKASTKAEKMYSP
jgi:hypothetical protein